MAKPLAGGLPLGAILANEKFAAAFTPECTARHSAAARWSAPRRSNSCNVIEDENLLENVRERGAELRAGSKSLPRNSISSAKCAAKA